MKKGLLPITPEEQALVRAHFPESASIVDELIFVRDYRRAMKIMEILNNPAYIITIDGEGRVKAILAVRDLD